MNAACHVRSDEQAFLQNDIQRYLEAETKDDWENDPAILPEQLNRMFWAFGPGNDPKIETAEEQHTDQSGASW